MKKILITAGPVYGRLDDNKIVSNRSRGLWAIGLAEWLNEHTDHQITLLVTDLIKEQVMVALRRHKNYDQITIHVQDGYKNYSAICKALAPHVDAAIMAAAVVNWIPETPFPGKMPTDKKRQDIAFFLAPRVINGMKKWNPKLTLIGCKLLFSNDYETLIDAAYGVVLAAKCNAVVANDAHIGLRTKYIVHQDRSVSTFDNDFDGMYQHLLGIIEDVHYHTEQPHLSCTFNLKSKRVFNAIVNKHRHQFIRRIADDDFVFGSVAVRDFHSDEDKCYYVSPREKGEMFDAEDAVEVRVDRETRTVFANGGKATLNAPLLVRHLEKYPEAAGVLHYHAPETEDPGIRGLLPQVEHAPPGTARDNERSIPGPHYYIKGHGWIIAVDENGEPILHNR